jgi:CBS domain-containing protein
MLNLVYKITSMLKNINVSEIMTREVVTVDVEQELTDVHHIIVNRGIRHLPVMREQKIEGMISKTDYLRLTFGTIYPDTEQQDDAIMELFELKDLMVKNPFTISSSATVKEAMEIFMSHEFHALPVVDDGVLVGILSVSDVLNYFAKQLH